MNNLNSDKQGECCKENVKHLGIQASCQSSIFLEQTAENATKMPIILTGNKKRGKKGNSLNEGCIHTG